MKWTVRLAIIGVMVVQVFYAPLTMATEGEDEPPLVLPELVINKVVAGAAGQTSYEYIELYNPNSEDIFVESWRVIVSRSEGNTRQEFALNGTIKAHGYILIAGQDGALNNLDPDFRLKSNTLVTTGGIVQIADDTGEIIDEVRWGDATSPSLALPTGAMLERNYIDGLPWLTGDNLKDFTSKPHAAVVPKSGGFIPYVAPVYRCTGVIISEIAPNTADQFVELHNPTSRSVRIDGCLLQTNRSATKSEVLSGVITPGGYKVVHITSTELTLTKTTTGTVYLLSSDGNEETDIRSYEKIAAGASWAWFGGNDWRQTYAVSPGKANVWQEFLPCEKGYVRNPETGRCRKVVVPKTLADCGPGKYRNPETNRCRNVANAASKLVPCKAGQYRNLETNRCRSLASAANSLKPCKEGQERNPETNRCRNVVKDIPAAAFKVEPIEEGESAFAGWWALGGVGALAVGYGAWEWRREAMNAIRKIATFFTSGK